jgi:peptidoglycan hydrolase-like protein with peptidoglycan-binding domain
MRLPKAPAPDRISEIQTALARGGYYDGDPTGKWDPRTMSALQNFQSANSLDPNGKIDALSLQKLGLGSDIAGVSAPKAIAPATSGAPVPVTQSAPSGGSFATAHSAASSSASSPVSGASPATAGSSGAASDPSR